MIEMPYMVVCVPRERRLFRCARAFHALDRSFLRRAVLTFLVAPCADAFLASVALRHKAQYMRHTRSLHSGTGSLVLLYNVRKVLFSRLRR